MTSKLATKIKHTQIVRDIKAILGRGRESAQKERQRQILQTNWEVGKYLAENLPLDETPSTKNTKTIKHLARTFEQPEAYFYMVMKFYRCYSKLSKNDLSLSWTHYRALLTADDSGS